MTLITQHFHLRIETNPKNGTIVLNQSLSPHDEDNEIILNPDAIDTIINDLQNAKKQLLEELSEK
jgi:hypothetical protein